MELTIHDIDRPDRVIFDLDPGERVRGSTCKKLQCLPRDAHRAAAPKLAEDERRQGPSLRVPLAPKFDYQDVKGWSQAVVNHVARPIPGRYVVKSGGASRVGKIFIDYLRNGHDQTTAAAFSAGPVPGSACRCRCRGTG